MRGNTNFGILLHENPVRYPPTADTIFFQSSGNRIEKNIVSGSRYFLAQEGGLFGAKQSVNNCFAGNLVETSLPADLAPWSCANATTPNADALTNGTLLTLILGLQAESQKRVMKPQPAPPPQPTMPRPCRGAPRARSAALSAGLTGRSYACAVRRPLLAGVAVALLAVAPSAWAASIVGTRGPDRIAAQGELRDRVRCGAGRDVVTADLFDQVAADCEVVSRRLSRDTTMDFGAQHETQVEPDSFSYGRTIVTAFQSGRFAGGGAAAIGWATSADTGTTWRSGLVPSTSERVSDPAVAYDAVHGVWLIALLGVSEHVVDILLSRSPDGVRWEQPATVVVAASPDADFDKEWIACDNWPASPYRGRCYLSYLNLGTGQIETRRSADGGATWSESAVSSAGPPPQSIVNGAQPVVRPDGAVVVGFMVIAPFVQGDDWIGASRSLDGGASFSEAARVADLEEQPILGMRAPALPSLDVDAGGRVYGAWADCRFRLDCRATDIVVATSPDGAAWAPPSRVPTRNPAERVDHLVPGLAADPAKRGVLAITYYSLRQPDGCPLEDCPGLDVSAISSKDGGLSWSRPQRLNAKPMKLAWLADGGIGQMVGDYISTSWAGGRPVPVFSLASEPGGFDLLHQSIFATTLLH